LLGIYRVLTGNQVVRISHHLHTVIAVAPVRPVHAIASGDILAGCQFLGGADFAPPHTFRCFPFVGSERHAASRKIESTAMLLSL